MKNTPENSPEVISRRSFLRHLAGIEGQDGRYSFADTARLSFAVFTPLIASQPILSEQGGKVGVNIGNKGMQEGERIHDRYPFHEELLVRTLLIPPLEEGVCRGIPNLILMALKARGPQWKVGLPVSILFAAYHNVYTDEQGKHLFSTDTLPLNQLIGGAFVWKMMRDRGWMHAVVAHSVYNVIDVIGSYFSRAR